MGWVARLLGREQKAWGEAELAMLRDIYGTRESISGRSVTWKTALDVSTILACTRVLADGVATVPLKLMRRDPATGRRAEAADHPASWLLSHAPNDWQTSVDFRDTLMMHLALCRNGYVFKVRAPDGRLLELLPVAPAMVRIVHTGNDAPRYFIRAEPGRPEFAVPEGAMWHIRALAWDGVTGHEAINAAREAIGLALATEEQHSRLHKNGMQSPGIYSVTGTLNPKQYDDLRRYLEKHVQGLANAHKPLILDRDAKWTPIAAKGVDAEHLATRRFQIEENCRAMGVLPIMVGHSNEQTTFASSENMFLAHNVHTIRPWHRRWEASANRSFLTRREIADGYYFKFFDGELLRGAAKDRAEFYAKALGAGGSPAWLTPNDIRGFEDMDPIEGGDDLPKPAGAAASPPAPPSGE
jgi:HK97 family phage portal protein